MSGVPALALALFAAGSAPSLQEPLQESKATARAEELAGHRRMLEVLADIHAKMPRQNTYFGDRKLRKIEQEIAGFDPQLSRKALARLHHDLAQNQLRLGSNEQAVESFEKSLEIVSEFPRAEWPPFAEKLAYNLGMAWMRVGERANCVLHHSAESCILPIRGTGVHADREGSRQALRWLREALRGAGENQALALSARWLVNVAAMTLGEYPGALSEEERLPPSLFTSEVLFPRFQDVAPALGVNCFDLSGGAVADDLDGDGLLDLLSSSWATDGQIRFFKNVGDGTFEERTDAANLRGIVGGLNLLQGDTDDDGDLDVVVLRGAWFFGPAGELPNSLLRNEGGSFLDVTFRAGLGEHFRPTQAGGFADYDLDGDLDLYVGNEASPEARIPSELFQNQGDGTFRDRAKEAGVENFFFAKGVTWGDYDEDGFPDLYVSNLASPNRLYHNRGEGTFEEVAGKLGVAWPLKCFPVWFFDYDDDGHLDLYVSTYDQGQPDADFRLAPVVASMLGQDPAVFGAELPRLYKGDGKGGFRDVAAEVGLTAVTLPMGANFGDLDNDGFLDFYLGTGYPGYDGLIPNLMYWNRGGKRFVDVTIPGGFGHLQKGHGVAFADLDQDGDQDVFEQMGGGYPGDAFGNVLYENPGFGNHWLKVRLIGVESNRFGVGSRLRAEIVERGTRRSVFRHVNSGGSFGCNPLVQHLGLGQAEKVEVLEVFWPKTKKTQVFRDVPADRRVEITEGSDELRVIEERSFRFRARE